MDKAPAKRTTAERLVAAVAELAGGVESTGRNRQFGAFLGDKDVTRAWRTAAANHGIVLLGAAHMESDDTYETGKGTTMRRVVVRVEWRAQGPDDHGLALGSTLGEASDVSDKAIAKAQTIARKYLLRFICSLVTGDDPDEENPEPMRTPASEEKPEPLARARSVLDALLIENGLNVPRLNQWLRREGMAPFLEHNLDELRHLYRFLRDDGGIAEVMEHSDPMAAANIDSRKERT